MNGQLEFDIEMSGRHCQYIGLLSGSYFSIYPNCPMSNYRKRYSLGVWYLILLCALHIQLFLIMMCHQTASCSWLDVFSLEILSEYYVEKRRISFCLFCPSYGYLKCATRFRLLSLFIEKKTLSIQSFSWMSEKLSIVVYELSNQFSFYSLQYPGCHRKLQHIKDGLRITVRPAKW
jgi:hypothetical protein